MKLLTPSRDELVPLAVDAAKRHSLKPSLVCAIVEQESGFDPWAIRGEPGFYKKYEEPQNLTPSEEFLRSVSFGLMQVMGESARALGFKGYLSLMHDPETGLEIGCQWFQVKLAKAHGDIRQALLYWNGGGDPLYPDKVFARMKNFEGFDDDAKLSAVR